MIPWSKGTRASAYASLVVTFAHCGVAELPAPQTTIRDSAGIRIVTSGSAREDGWSLAAQPVLVLSGPPGDSAQHLDVVVAAAYLNDGRMVVANRIPPMLRWYDASGRYQHGTGRVGSGPGDFGGEGMGVTGMWRIPGDSIAAWDALQQRIQVFEPAGRYVRGFRLNAPPSPARLFAPHVVGFLANGAVIAGVNLSAAPGQGTDRWRDLVFYQQWSATGHYESGLAELPGLEIYTPSFQQRNQPGGMAVPGGHPPPPAPLPPFAREASAATGGDRLYYADADHYEISIHDGVAAPGVIIRRETPRRAVTSALRESYAREMLGPVRSALRTDFQRWLKVAVYPDSLPAYQRIEVADGGNVWAQEYQAPEADTLTWSIFQADGAWLANIQVPARLRVLHVGGDNVLALSRNELDVESVHVYRLIRPSQRR
ncbi:MAG: hypothetical protein ACRENP_08090 [Longimicrobiales bacterium]